MNRVGLETLEKRLDVTRRALAGEQERARVAHEAAEHAAGYAAVVDASVVKTVQLIADLEDALAEARGWAPDSGYMTIEQAREALGVAPEEDG